MSSFFKFYLITRAHINFPIAEKAQAAELVKRTLDKYGKSIQELGFTEQTGVVINLLQDLTQTPVKEAVNIIGATPWVTILQKTNEQYIETFIQRTEIEATLKTGKTNAARLAMQAALTKMCKLINALALVHGEAAYKKLSDSINEEISSAKQIAKRRRSARSAIQNRT